MGDAWFPSQREPRCPRENRTIADDRPSAPLPQFRQHPRVWRSHRYVYPVISRRSKGLSLGINLNPDRVCNFHCVYCQVDRTTPPPPPDVDPEVVRAELLTTAQLALSGELFADADFAAVPPELHRLNDFAFSGDGEPTASPRFAECVEVAIDVKRALGLHDCKIVVITNACFLTRPAVMSALARLDEHQGEVWAKLDAGSQAYFDRVNQAATSLDRIVENIAAAGQIRPVVIQTLFAQLHGVGPDDAELRAYCDRLNDVQRAGGQIDYVQLHTLARPPTEGYVTALPAAELARIADTIRADTQVRVEVF